MLLIDDKNNVWYATRIGDLETDVKEGESGSGKSEQVAKAWRETER